ncbi:MAG: hypothetical protein U0Z44_12145 [Kouleothrix sp.]
MQIKVFTLTALLILISMILAACGGATPQTPAAPTAAAGGAQQPRLRPQAAPAGGRHCAADQRRAALDQDETRFGEALTKAGYQAEILFSQGDSARRRPTSSRS